MWSAVAPGWAAHADFIDDRGVDVTDAMLFITAPQPGERVLELACGPGGPGFAAAPLVAPWGAVVVSDVSAEMTAIAAARARDAGWDRCRAGCSISRRSTSPTRRSMSCCVARG